MATASVDVILRLLGSKNFQKEAAASSAAISGLGKGAVATSARVKAAGAKTAAIGASMTRGITAPIAIGMGLAVKATMDFDKQLSALGAVSGATGAQMKVLRQQAIDLGQATIFSAGEAAQAQTELAKGGMDVQQVMRSMPGTLNLAAAGEMELKEAAAATVNTLNLFGLRAGAAGKVADQFATAANQTTAEVHDYTDALTSAGSVTHMAGLTMRDTNSWLMALADTGLKGARAGTSIRTAMIQLLKPTKQQGEAAKAAGLNFRTAGGEMKDQTQIATMLRNKLSGMTKAQRTQVLATIAGQDGVRALNALYNAGPGKMRAYEKALGKSGTAARVAAKRQKNFAGTMEQLRGSMETAAIQVGTVLIPVLDKIVKGITKAVNAFSSLSPGMQGVIVKILVFAAVMGPALVVIGRMVVIMTRLWTLFKIIRAALIVLRVAFATTWLAALGPIGLIIIAVVAVAAVFVLLYKKVGWFRKGVQAVWNWIKSNWKTLLTILAGPIGIAVALIVKHFDKIKAAGKAAWTWIKNAWNDAKSFFAGVGGAIASGITDHFNRLKDAVEAVLGVVGDLLGKIGDLAGKVASLPGKAIDFVFGATGTTISSGKTAVVGERGPEMLKLPTGSKITPLPQGALAASGAGGGTMQPIQLVVDGRVLAETTARVVKAKAARA